MMMMIMMIIGLNTWISKWKTYKSSTWNKNMTFSDDKLMARDYMHTHTFIHGSMEQNKT